MVNRDLKEKKKEKREKKKLGQLESPMEYDIKGQKKKSAGSIMERHRHREGSYSCVH